MKILSCAALSLVLLACAQSGGTDAATNIAEAKNEINNAAPAATETTATTADAKTPAANEEKPMSYYQDKVAVIHTSQGDIKLRFFPNVAPNHVKNFIDLAEKGFYNGTKFHRVIPGFMIQGGDPNTISGDPGTWGMGGNGSNYVKAEFNDTPHKRGTLSMARSSDPNSASSQFFICVADAGFLDRQYTAFGEVLSGMDVADKIVNAPRDRNDRPNQPTSITSIEIRPATDAEKSAPAAQ